MSASVAPRVLLHRVHPPTHHALKARVTIVLSISAGFAGATPSRRWTAGARSRLVASPAARCSTTRTSSTLVCYT